MFWTVFLLVTILKLMLLPTYRSTDFEVHRNWLAITHSLPLKLWYFDETSEWTLDYPPFFAYFEYGLSHIAKWFDSDMLIVSNLNYASDKTILFQRLSVIVSDVVYAVGVKSCLKHFSAKPHQNTLIAFLLLGNFGLIIIDHIHFQYNGLLFGILLISMAKMIQSQYLQSAFFFAILLNMKHIFVYASPVYIAFLLKFYCWGGSLTQSVKNILKLAIITLGVTALSFGPFYDHIPQVMSRLFPFKRGLCHAYWAPNFWALYNVADKVAAYVWKVKSAATSNTGGLVQEFDHLVLPSIKPLTTFALSAAFMLPCVIKIFTLKLSSSGTTHKNFVGAIAICTATSFIFGWHVHEKAILMVFIPFSLLIASDQFHARNIVLLSVVTNYSLLPLLFTPELLIIKLALYLLYISFTLYCTSQLYTNWKHLFPIHEKLYIFGFSLVFFYEHFVQYILGWNVKYEFLPLLLTSVYCSLGIIYFWFKYYFWFLTHKHPSDKDSKSNKKKIGKKKK